MNGLSKTVGKLDELQRRYPFTAFIYAVVKKYGDDEAGYQAALLTYYAFLSLFPLLLVVTTLTTMIAGTHSTLHAAITRSTATYFPVLGNQLEAHITTLHKGGLALFIGILFTLYGARGVADAFRRGVHHIWGIPKSQQDGFPKAAIKSIGLVVIGGAGFLAASIIASIAGAAGHGVGFRLLSVAINAIILFLLFTFLLNASLPKHVTVKELRAGAVTAALGLVIVQTLGGLLVAHQLKHLDALYSYFAIALGLLFWIYLQAQVLFYAVEISVVSAQQWWPRGLTDKNPTPADKRAKKQFEQAV